MLLRDAELVTMTSGRALEQRRRASARATGTKRPSMPPRKRGTKAGF